MARNLAIQALRTTRANLDTQATAENLLQGEIYLITDENRFAVGLSATTYETYAKESEISEGITSTTVDHVEALTQAAYDALTPDADTVYFIIPA